MKKNKTRKYSRFLILLTIVSHFCVQESWSIKVDCPHPEDIHPSKKNDKWILKGSSTGRTFFFTSIREYASPNIFENANFMGVEKRNNQLYCRYRTARHIFILKTDDAAVKHCTEAPIGGEFTYFDCP